MTALQWNQRIQPPETAAEARLELAAVCRLVAREGMAPIGGARFAVRDPEREGIYFANPGGLLLDEISASKLIEVDRNGTRLADGAAEPDSGALALVLAALEAKPDAAGAAQVASTAGTVVASLRDGLLPITQTSFMFDGGLPSVDWEPAISQDVLRESIANEMSESCALLVRGHGTLVAGTTMAQLWKLVFFLNKCCQSQVDAMAAANAVGRSLTIPSKAVIDHAVVQSRAFVDHPRFVADWPSFLEQLDRENPSYRD